MTVRRGGKSAELYRRRVKPVQDTAPATGSHASASSAAIAEIASYIAEISAEMERMASAAKLEFLAYLLAMARIEAETVCHQSERT